MKGSPYSYSNYNTINYHFLRLESDNIVGQKSSGFAEHKRSVSNMY